MAGTGGIVDAHGLEQGGVEAGLFGLEGLHGRAQVAFHKLVGGFEGGPQGGTAVFARFDGRFGRGQQRLGGGVGGIQLFEVGGADVGFAGQLGFQGLGLL